jgi:hypothetical protein
MFSCGILRYKEKYCIASHAHIICFLLGLGSTIVLLVTSALAGLFLNILVFTVTGQWKVCAKMCGDLILQVLLQILATGPFHRLPFSKVHTDLVQGLFHRAWVLQSQPPKPVPGHTRLCWRPLSVPALNQARQHDLRTVLYALAAQGLSLQLDIGKVFV